MTIYEVFVRYLPFSVTEVSTQ